MSVPSMVHRSGDTLVVRSVVSGDALYAEDESNGNALLAKELPECKVKRNYSCNTCDFFTQNPRHYLYHIRDVHHEKVRIYECPNCLYASKHFQKLLRHTKMVHGDNADVSKKGRKRPVPPPPEDESNESHTSTDELPNQTNSEDDSEHAHPTANDKDGFKCSVCPFSGKTQAQLTRHEREEHIKTKFFRCTKCNYVTHMKARFTKHVKYHSMPMIKCDMCDFRTPYKWNLDRHCKNHNGKGTFKCSACNFTADIKQSLTVHEMNHHVPPVGQAAGLGVGRRRNKVGASDTTAAEDAASQVKIDPEVCETSLLSEKRPALNTKVPAKKLKTVSNQDHAGDFVHPDDIIQHANGNIYIKNKCKLCSYKTAWDSEMARHQELVHNISSMSITKKKPSRPVPNLIPIPPKISKTENIMSQKDMDEICAKSKNSVLKDFASLIEDDVFLQDNAAPPALFDLNSKSSAEKKSLSKLDAINEKFSVVSSESLTCQLCGHQSKCLTELYSHKKVCGKESTVAMAVTPVHKLSSTRCQHCRQRCKSSMDLYNHLQTCPEAVKYFTQSEDDFMDVDDGNNNLEIVTEEENSRSSEKEPHPMENKVFVWNDILTPLADVDESKQYESFDEKQEDACSLDPSNRTQSPSSECSILEMVRITSPVVTHTTDKVPTHGNDISIAQHKRVFKCPHCTFWASTASRFHVHIVGHLNKKPFECSLCAYRSNWRWDITKHIKLKSVRDPNHESAKVLMTDETGRRNYTKYNKYLTECAPGGPESHDSSGGMGTRPKHDLPKVTRSPGSLDFGGLLGKAGALRPPPALKVADEAFLTRLSSEKKRSNNDNKKTLWQCKKCNFRDPYKEKLLAHVKSCHVPAAAAPASGAAAAASTSGSSSSSNGAVSTTARHSAASTSGELDSEASVVVGNGAGGGSTRGQAPFRCGHCHQVSNWKHVIQRHCRLKHSGDIKVIVASKNPDKNEFDSSYEEIDGNVSDVSQLGPMKCYACPYSADDHDELQNHLEGHKRSGTFKCNYCTFSVMDKEDLYEHLKIHSRYNYLDMFMLEKPTNDAEPNKKFKCVICPYDTNSKSQFDYHKQFHKPQNGQYSCNKCNYNVSKRHLLHQHMKVHGLTVSPHKQNGELVDDVSNEIEEIQSQNFEWQSLTEIPLVWVSKAGKFSKMYKCRYCPHVNLRKVNIQEHEKMHGSRDKTPAKGNETEHRCPECNYVCNNAGVLSSHSKVHQDLYGTIHGLVDTAVSDEEQIREFGNGLSVMDIKEEDTDEESLWFCNKCPARFLNENEYRIHADFHGSRLTYKCEHCTYTAKQRPHLHAHNKVHTFEYQERTRTLVATYQINADLSAAPEVIICPKTKVWIVADDSNSDNEAEMGIECVVRSRTSIPLSGTDLYQQKSEAEANERNADGSDSTTGKNLMYFSKNGKTREKCYKCPECPNAFDKREQYNAHIARHGSQQYHLPIAANEVKHSINHIDIKEETNSEDSNTETSNDLSPKPSPTGDMKSAKVYWCSMCPYTSDQKEAVDQHQTLHYSISGVKGEHNCDYCDYTAPQAHILDEHTKLHFVNNKVHRADGFMTCDSIRLTIASEVDGKEDKEEMSFTNKAEDVQQPSLKLNNNDGETMTVNRNGEICKITSEMKTYGC